MTDIEATKRQLVDARAVLAQRRQEASEAKSQIEESRKALPSTTSQQNLRSRFSGMQGRTQRQAIERADAELSEKIQAVGDYENELSDYENTQITPTEEAISNYEAEVSAQQKAEKLISDGMAGAYIQFGDNPRVKAYLERYISGQKADANTQELVDSVIERYNRGETIKDVDFNLFMKRGLLSFEEKEIPAEQLEAKQKYNAFVMPSDSVNNVLGIAKSSNLNTKKEFSALSSPSIWAKRELLPMASAKSLVISGLDRAEATLNSPSFSLFGLPRYIEGKGEKLASKIAPKLFSKYKETGEALAQKYPTGTRRLGYIEQTTSGAVAGALFVPVMATSADLALSGKSASQLRQLRKLETETPELSLALQKSTGDVNTLLVASRRATPKARIDTITGFKIRPTGENTFQIVGGKGVNRIIFNQNLKNPEIETSTFTFFGRGAETTARGVTRRQGLTISQNIEERNPIFGNIRVVDENLKGSSSNFAGFSRQGNRFTEILSGSVKDARAYKTGDEIVVDLFKNKVTKKPIYDRKVGKFKPEGIGLLKNVETRESGNIFFNSARGTKTILKSNQETLGGTLSLGFEKKALQTAIKTASKTSPKTNIVSSLFSGVGMASAQSTQKEKTKVVTTNILNSAEQTASKTKGKTINILEGATNEKTRPLLSEATIQTPAQASKSRLITILGIMSGTRSVQKNKYRSKGATKTINRTPKLFKTPTEKTITSNSKGKITKDENGNYRVYVRRFGEDVFLGYADSLSEAVRMLKNNLESTLGASGFVSRNEQREDIGDMLGSRFGKSKKEKNRFVQKNKYRLGSFGEVREINFFKNKRNKKKGFSWFS